MARILLIRPNSDINRAPVPLGLMYLSSYLKKHDYSHTIKIVDGRADDIKKPSDYAKIITDFLPDIMGVTVMHSDAEPGKQIARLLKQICPTCSVVFGGAYPSFDHVACLNHNCVDFAVIGEGEQTFMELVHALDGQKPLDSVKGIAFRTQNGVQYNGDREPIGDLDAIPFPDYDSIDIGKYFSGSKPVLTNPFFPHERGVHIFSSRGCPFPCTYCHHIFGKRTRSRSVDNVMAEINMLSERYGITAVEFLDDMFNFDLNRAKTILQRIIDSGYKYRLFFPNGFRIDRMDQEFLHLLKRAGTDRIAFGIETASPRIQDYIKKKLDLEEARQVIKMTVDTGIHACGFFMLGFPGETVQEMMLTVNYACSTALSTATFHIVNPYPGTEFFERYFRENAHTQNQQAYSTFDRLSVNISAVTDAVLYKTRSLAYRKFYLNWKRMIAILLSLLSSQKGSPRTFQNVFRILWLSFFGKQ